MAIGLGAVMVGVQNAANAGVPADKAGLAAALITTSSTVGAALGLAILTRNRDQPNQSPHRRARKHLPRSHRRVPGRAPRLQRLPGRCRCDRRPRHQRSRAASDRRRHGRAARGKPQAA